MIKSNEEIRQRFYKEFTRYYEGDSGFNGNDPQEPIWTITDDPKEVADFFLTQRAEDWEEVKKMVENIKCEVCKDYAWLEYFTCQNDHDCDANDCSRTITCPHITFTKKILELLTNNP